MKAGKIIEFTGIPNSGKTTLIRRLQNELPEKYGITVQVQREDAEIVPHCIPKKTWDRNVWITFGQLQSLVEAYHSSADIVLLDRGLFDAMFWSQFMLTESTSTIKQSIGMNNILQKMCHDLGFYPDYLFLIDVSVEEALRRRALMEGTSVYSKPDFLNKYRSKFFQVFGPYIENNYDDKVIDIPSFYYDTTAMTSDEIFDKVSRRICNICNK